MQNNRSLLLVIVSILCIGTLGFLVWHPYSTSKTVERDEIVPAPVSATTAQVSEPSTVVDSEQKESAVQNNYLTNKPKTNMTDTNVLPDGEMTEAELIAELKEITPKIATFYEKDELTPEEEVELEVLNTEKEKLTALLQEKDTDGISALLQVVSYGYDVVIKINGADIGIKGGKSEGARLFNKEHYSYELATPSAQRLYVLKEGENSISVEYVGKEGETQPTNGSVVFYFNKKELFNLPITGEKDSIQKTVVLKK